MGGPPLVLGRADYSKGVQKDRRAGRGPSYSDQAPYDIITQNGGTARRRPVSTPLVLRHMSENPDLAYQI